MVGTSETWVIPPVASASRTRAASKPSCTTSVDPYIAVRWTMANPPTWCRGMQASQRSSGPSARRSPRARALASWFARVSSTGRGSAVVPEVKTIDAASLHSGTGGGPACGSYGTIVPPPRQSAWTSITNSNAGRAGTATTPPRAPASAASSERVSDRSSPMRTARSRGTYRRPAMDEADRQIRPGADWQPAGEYEDIRYETAEGIAKVTIARPEVRNAFRPETLVEVSAALERAREDPEIGVIILTGEGPLAFCSGGDQNVRGDTGYMTGGQGVGRFHVTDLQVQMRRLPKPIVAMVAGYAVGGGQVLNVCCDLSIAADNARFGQTGPRVGSFDGGFGAALLAQQVGQKKAKEIWFLCRQYDAQQALGMGLVNTVVPLEELEEETVRWAREMLALSPFSLRLLKASFHAAEDGMAGLQQLAHDTNLLFYASDEAKEGREAYKERRRPEFEKFPKRP